MPKRGTTNDRQRKSIRLSTGISKAFWCEPDDGRFQFKAARIPTVMNNPAAEDLCWFDELFSGSIVIPASLNRPRAITLLITGPPGTGKSTLATELCVRLAKNGANERLGGKFLYLASEAHPPWMVQNAKSFGWIGPNEAAEDLFDLGVKSSEAPIAIRTLSQVATYIDRERENKIPILDDLEGMFGLKKMFGPRTNGEEEEEKTTAPNFADLGLVIIDSLNSAKGDRAAEFEKFHNNFVRRGPRLIIFVLDSSPTLPVSETWEFASDIVVRLDKEYNTGYMVRTIEVVKARYQVHAWGKHQLKIYESPKLPAKPDAVGTPEVQSQRLRAHPYRPDGGIFIFPSVHYLLSRYKRSTPSSFGGMIGTPIPALNDLLNGGLPSGRTTALIGDRGAHKSHLGYFQILQNVLRTQGKGKSLIISLRDDEGMARHTLDHVLRDWPEDTKGTKVNDLIASGRLEIAYFMPGYITPDEFFHRMLLSIYRMRKGDDECPITLLFNSLDQIESRFPLCAKEKVFIPAIIQTLAAIGVTSIFVGADTEGSGKEGADEGLRDLLSMAELIITLRRKQFSRLQIAGILKNAYNDSVVVGKHGSGSLKSLPATIQSTELTVDRYAGGQAAGAQGLVELVTDKSLFKLILKQGLQVVPYLPGRAKAAAV